MDELAKGKMSQRWVDKRVDGQWVDEWLGKRVDELGDGWVKGRMGHWVKGGQQKGESKSRSSSG